MSDVWDDAEKDYKGPKGPTAPSKAPAASEDDWKIWDVKGSGGGGGTSTAGSDLVRAGTSFGGEMLSNLNPAKMASGAIDTLKHPFAGMSENRDKVGKDISSGNYTDAAIHALGGILPLIGPAYAKTMDAISTGTPEEAGSSMADVVSTRATPGAYGLAGKAVGSVAPGIAESAMGIRKLDRAHGATPGKAILNETGMALSPDVISERARARMGNLGGEVNQKLQQSTQPTDTGPALKLINDAEDAFIPKNNNTAIQQLSPMRAHLVQNEVTGQRIPQQMPATDMQALKQGFGEKFFHHNPETLEPVSAIGNQVYHALKSQLEDAAPGVGDLNQRISSLIPVAKRAEATTRSPGIGEGVMGRVAAKTGALTGAVAGLQMGGIPGMLMGILAPELFSAPGVKMLAARGANASGKALPAIGKAGKTSSLAKQD